MTIQHLLAAVKVLRASQQVIMAAAFFYCLVVQGKDKRQGFKKPRGFPGGG